MTNPSPAELLEDESDDEAFDGVPRAVGADVTGILARRLEELRDERWLVPVLETALARMTGHNPSVERYEIEYCKIKPNRDINVCLRARVAGLNGEAPVSQRFACTLYASTEVCRAKGAEDELRAPSDATRRRLARAGFASALAVVDDPAMIVRAFPDDPNLHGLAPATDEGEMLPLFASRLEACRGASLMPVALEYEILHYKPRRSCAIHYRIGLAPARGGEAVTARVFGKLARDERGLRNHQLLSAAWKASEASNGVWRAARPVGYVHDWHLLLQEAVPGRDFRLVFLELTPDDAGPTELDRAGLLIEAIARAIRAVQAAPIPPGSPILSFENLLQSQERNLRYMAALRPDLAAEVARLRAEIERLGRATRPGPPVFAHGDFAHGNVLIEDERVGIIDFDKAGAAEAVYDVAYFLTHMWSFGIRHPRRMPHVEKLWGRFRDGYLSLAPEVSPARLSLYEALDFAAYVLRNFRKQSHQEGWVAWARAQIEAAWERLDEAGR